jgi:protein SCO1/2
MRLLLACLALLVVLAPAAAEQKGRHELLLSEPTAINPRYLLAGPSGQAVSNEDFRGRFQLIAFGYTFCPDICPTTLVEMAGVLGLLGEQAGRLQPIFISLDPERDTVQILKTYTAFFDPRIIGLTGSPELVKRAAQNFKVRYAKVINPDARANAYALDHSAGMYLLGPDGQFIKKFAYGTEVSSLAAEISSFINLH